MDVEEETDRQTERQTNRTMNMSVFLAVPCTDNMLRCSKGSLTFIEKREKERRDRQTRRHTHGQEKTDKEPDKLVS